MGLSLRCQVGAGDSQLDSLAVDDTTTIEQQQRLHLSTMPTSHHLAGVDRN